MIINALTMLLEKQNSFKYSQTRNELAAGSLKLLFY